MPYTSEQIQALQQINQQRDELTEDQRALLDQHLKQAQTEAQPLTSTVTTEEPPGPVTGPTLRDLAEGVGPLLIGGGATGLAAKGAQTALKQAPNVMRLLGTLGAESAAGVGAELGMQQTGLTQDDPLSLPIAATAPLLGFGAARGLSILPGTEKLTQNLAAGEMRALPQQIGIAPVSTSLLYKSIIQQNPSFRVAGHNTLKGLQDIAQKQAAIPEEALQSKTVQKLVDSSQQELLSRGGSYTLPEAQARLSALREATRSSTEGSTEHNVYKYLAAQATKDLDDAANSLQGDAARALLYANKMYRKEIAQADLAYTIAKKGIKAGEKDLKTIKPRAIMEWIDSPDNEFWRNSLDPAELKGIRSWLEKAPEIKIHQGGAPVGSWQRAALVGGGSLLAGVGPKTAAGMATAAFFVQNVLDAISWAVTNPKIGRKVLEPLLKDNGNTFTPRMYEIVSAAAAAHARGNITRNSQPDIKLPTDSNFNVFPNQP